MTQEKTIEVLRKRNTQLQEELDAVKGQSERFADDSKNKRVDDLIAELEGIKKQWQEVLNDLKEEKTKYSELIKDMRCIRETFETV